MASSKWWIFINAFINQSRSGTTTFYESGKCFSTSNPFTYIFSVLFRNNQSSSFLFYAWNFDLTTRTCSYRMVDFFLIRFIITVDCQFAKDFHRLNHVLICHLHIFKMPFSFKVCACSLFVWLCFCCRIECIKKNDEDDNAMVWSHSVHTAQVKEFLCNFCVCVFKQMIPFKIVNISTNKFSTCS